MVINQVVKVAKTQTVNCGSFTKKVYPDFKRMLHFLIAIIGCDPSVTLNSDSYMRLKTLNKHRSAALYLAEKLFCEKVLLESRPTGNNGFKRLDDKIMKAIHSKFCIVFALLAMIYNAFHRKVLRKFCFVTGSVLYSLKL